MSGNYEDFFGGLLKKLHNITVTADTDVGYNWTNELSHRQPHCVNKHISFTLNCTPDVCVCLTRSLLSPVGPHRHRIDCVSSSAVHSSSLVLVSIPPRLFKRNHVYTLVANYVASSCLAPANLWPSSSFLPPGPFYPYCCFNPFHI